MSFFRNSIISFALGIILGILIILIITNFTIGKNFLTPLISSPETLSTKVPSKKPIMAYLPYWNINSAQINYHLIDSLIYFDVGLNYDGSIKKMEGHNMDMGWYYLSQGLVDNIFTNCDKTDVKKIISITAFDNEVIDSLLLGENYKKNAINSIKYLVDQYDLDGINLDFEYNLGNNNIQARTGQNYDLFISDLKKEIPNIEISVCIYTNGIIKDFPYQAEKITKEADYLILMAYDFHNISSFQAGPISPVHDVDNKASISKAIDSAIQKNINLEKIILAMPFYGYEWRTVSDQFGSNTYEDSGAMASYRRTHELIKDENLKVNWDDLTMSPWIFYQDDLGFNKQIYFENDKSIGLKLEFINQTGLAGAGIWALGYEGKDAPVWNIIEKWRIAN